MKSDEIPSIGQVELKVPGLGSVTGISLNNEVHQYLGVPYGEVPGRFRRSVASGPWKNGQHDGTKLGPFCPQPPRDFYPVPTPSRPWLQVPVADELNCLNLNISIPRLPSQNEPTTLLPVMVFLHGGAFTYSTSASPVYDGRILASTSANLTKPAIVVTLNYRLGVYGFLAGHDLRGYNSENGEEAVGNYGIWDQVLALRWVQKHISAFGGDPSRVTLFGQSAGAASVHAHLLRGEPLFSSAILQSGLVWLCGVLSVDEYQVVYEKMLLNLGIPLDLPPTERMQRILAVDTARLTAAMVPTFITPVVTAPLCDDGVLVGTPLQAGPSFGKFEVPEWCPRIMMGDAKNECIIWNKSWDNLSPVPMVDGQDLATPSAELTLAKMKTYLGADAAQKLADAYGIKENSSPQDLFWALERMTSHGLYSAPIYFAQNDAIDAPSSTVFTYHFNVPSPYDNAWGGLAHHSNDNVLLWGVLRHTLPPAQQRIADKMAEAWITFANGDDPWEQSRAGNDKRMVFGAEAATKTKQENADWGYEIWEKLHADGLLSDLIRLSDELCLRKSELVCHA
ncbi:hypothetical protein AK830_g3511 [Neonectria ditissima]|uniref:Carboxylic ester hydrolase n=1 Tax=Neonectria ditissima TaxID=78410 RepID=A0A0P7BBI0_9HYPO|nr:hypothetical protein AK830_g3511 [Neonectria ditissima]